MVKLDKKYIIDGVMYDAVECARCGAWCTACAFEDTKCVAWKKLKELITIILTGEQK